MTYAIEHHSALGTTATVLTVAIPLALYIVSILGIYSQLTRTFDPCHLLLVAGSGLLVVTAVVLAATGAALGWPLAVLALPSWVTVVGYKTIGHRRGSQVVARIAASFSLTSPGGTDT